MLAGDVRDFVWDTLARARAVSYPLPPHGHNPNFNGAKAAAVQLLAHERLVGARVLVVGPERALLPLRKLALAEGRVLFVPHQKKEGRYWRLGDERGAQLSSMPAFGEEVEAPNGAQAVVLASVVVARDGGRLSKGFGWGARGVPLGVPQLTLAHPIMLRDRLPCEPDSRVDLIATPREVIAPA
ncbi:5-formyltetrahydrofolate cyclo-ligase [Deinococcus yavapaiensis]|uniref:5-formyltetrahydrofolate cyclo-ligase n=1 Tax=Deinococcus yavapaiensis KR-236 TaxID=694435 RepID=A0A318S694_9DEIO|nr:5-formyltetrahydrofolate cyclo-ligase [Deinococcus yavapaiensis]PYE51934.1 5-formyltetrahydrofolate cyclo-ligase [Deinococcus yavapaiensis KR-236]